MPNKVIPFGERILVKRKIVGEKAGSILLPQEVQERFTDLAIVQYIPDNTFADEELLSKAQDIINNISVKAQAGDSDALTSLIKYNEYLKLKSIKVGDEVMISKYVGLDFSATGEKEILTLVNCSDIIGLVVKDE